LQKIREAKQALEDEAREKAEQKRAEAEKKQAEEEEERCAGKKKRARKSDPPDPDKAKPASRQSNRSVQTRGSFGPRDGPKQTAEVGHFRMPKSSETLRELRSIFQCFEMAL
jgi:hypothetical protein